MNLEFAAGAHLCHLFTNPNEQKEVSLPFLREGLNLGEHCTFITATGSAVDDWYLELQAAGVDVETKRRTGALLVKASCWRRASKFNSVLMARRAWTTLSDSLVGFPGGRVLADMAWTLEPALPADQLCHWDASLNLVLDEPKVRTICQYDLGCHSPAAIHGALRTHPALILGSQIISNPYYEAEEILANEPNLNQPDADVCKVEEMLAALRQRN